jgi:hypothetical protein
MSLAKLAQLFVVDTQLGSAAAAITLFTSNYALDVQPLSSTALPASSNNTGNVTGRLPLELVQQQWILRWPTQIKSKTAAINICHLHVLGFYVR